MIFVLCSNAVPGLDDYAHRRSSSPSRGLHHNLQQGADQRLLAPCVLSNDFLHRVQPCLDWVCSGEWWGNRHWALDEHQGCLSLRHWPSADGWNRQCWLCSHCWLQAVFLWPRRGAAGRWQVPSKVMIFDSNYVLAFSGKIRFTFIPNFFNKKQMQKDSIGSSYPLFSKPLLNFFLLREEIEMILITDNIFGITSYFTAFNDFRKELFYEFKIKDENYENWMIILEFFRMRTEKNLKKCLSI